MGILLTAFGATFVALVQAALAAFGAASAAVLFICLMFVLFCLLVSSFLDGMRT